MADHVEALVLAIDEEYIRVPWRPKERTIAPCEADSCVTRSIAWPRVGLGLHDATHADVCSRDAMHDAYTKQSLPQA